MPHPDRGLPQCTSSVGTDTRCGTPAGIVVGVTVKAPRADDDIGGPQHGRDTSHHLGFMVCHLAVRQMQ